MSTERIARIAELVNDTVSFEDVTKILAKKWPKMIQPGKGLNGASEKDVAYWIIRMRLTGRA